jgi:hypothetical protein
MYLSDDVTMPVLAIGLIFGVGLIWAILLIRRLERILEQNLADSGRAMHHLQKLDRQSIASAKNLDSYRQDLQKLSSQIGTVAAAAAERHADVIKSLHDHDVKHETFANVLSNISETLSAIPPARQKESQRDNGLSKWRREVLSQDPALRFSVLWEWCSVNMLGILHRAARGWNSTNDLTANIPTYLEPEADVLNNSILVIGTRQHPETLAIPLRPLEASSDFQSWFESLPENPATAYVPALVMRSNGHFKLLARGTNSTLLTH